MLTATRRRKLVFNNDQIVTPKKRILIDNFNSGYIDELDINVLPLNSFYDGRNVKLDKKGSAKTREGLDALLATVPANTRIRSLGWFEREGEVPILVAAYDGKIGKVNTTTWAVDDIASGFTNTSDIFDFFSYNDNLYTVSGDAMKVYDNSSAWDAGLTAPASAPTPAISISAPEDALTPAEGSATGLTGTYKYKVANVFADGTSGPGPASAQITVADKKIDLSNIPIGPTGTTSRKVYRTKAYGIMYYLLTTIADNTTTTYEDSTADASLGAETEDHKNLNGEYTYRVTYVYGDRGESTASDASIAKTVVNGQVKLTSIPTGGAGVTQRVLYRTEGDDIDTSQRELHTIDDNTTTEYTDNTADASLTTTVTTISNVPAHFTFGIFKKKSSTFWGVDIANNPNRVWLCKALYPEVCESDSYVDLPNNDEIVCLVEYFDNVYVLCKKMIFKLTGEDIDSLSVSVVSQAIGAAARKTMKHMRQDLVFLSFNGVFTLSRVLLSSNAETVDVAPLSERVGATFDNLSYEYAHMASATIYKNMYIISFPYGGTAVQNNRTMVYNIVNKNWSPPWTGAFGNIASYVVGDIAGKDDDLLYAGTSTQTGKIYKWPGAGYNDDGQAIDSYFITAPLDGEMPESKKRWDQFFTEVELTGDWDLYCWYRKKLYEDITLGWNQKLIDLDPGYSTAGGELPSFGPTVLGFGDGVGFGSETSSEAMLVDTKGRKLSARSHYLQFKVGNNAQYNEHFKVFKMMIYFRPKKPRAT